MLRKQIKYDFKALFRVLLPIFGGVAALSVLTGVFIRVAGSFSDQDSVVSDVMQVLTRIFTLLCVLALIACTAAALFIIVRHYYRSLLCDEGYLTFTLPVTPDHVLGSKLITGFVCFIISLAVTVLSVCLLLLIGVVSYGSIGADFFARVADSLRAVAAQWTPQYTWGAVSFILLILLGTVLSLLQFFFAVTLGAKVSSRHKILCAVAFYFAVNIVLSILETAIFSMNFLTFRQEMDAVSIFNGMFGWQLVFITAVSAALYFICRGLLSKNLNLE